jgi:outer membrane protein assembly factor BamB
VVLQWLLWLVVPLVDRRAAGLGVLGGLAGGLVILIWWIFFSRARWSESLGAVVLMAIALAATLRVVHKSIAGGMMGMMPYLYGIPLLSLGLVAWAVAFGRLADGPRRALLVVALLLACVPMTLVRTDGITGDGAAQLAWRWSKTHEQRLLAKPSEKPTAPAPASSAAPTSIKSQPSADSAEKATPTSLTNAMAVAETEDKWPGFRGAARDGIIHGTRINTNWAATPPVLLWKRPVGPGWSSFAVQGEMFFTQEQRGEEEMVACYRVATGEPVWKHSDAVRFWESNAGPGPRATPSVRNGRVYTFGGTGILNALEAGDGAMVWTRNVASELVRKVPQWGFASSPLVVNDMVVVAAAGWLAAYDVATGEKRWTGPPKGWGYSSPQMAKIGGVEQILLVNGEGAISVSLAEGKMLWEYAWGGDGIVQPALTAEGDVLIGSGSGMPGVGVGTRRIAVAQGASGWTVAERWRSSGLKPYYNDFVLHKGFAFGFDGSLLACIDLKDGNRKWKGGRYGYGQLVLLADQDILLVLSEEGELALAAASPDSFTELARFQAIKGKTWNHPALSGSNLLVRNDEEMAAFRLTRISDF